MKNRYVCGNSMRFIYGYDHYKLTPSGSGSLSLSGIHHLAKRVQKETEEKVFIFKLVKIIKK